MESMMHLIFMTSSSNENFNGDCDHAVVELTADLIEQILRRSALARLALQHDADLFELYFWGGTAEFYDHEVVDACHEAVAVRESADDPDQAARDWLADLEQRGYAVMPDGFSWDAIEAQRTECIQMIVRNASSLRNELEIAWVTIPKHSDIYVTTWGLSLRVLEDLLAQPEPIAEPRS